MIFACTIIRARERDFVHQIACQIIQCCNIIPSGSARKIVQNYFDKSLQERKIVRIFVTDERDTVARHGFSSLCRLGLASRSSYRPEIGTKPSLQGVMLGFNAHLCSAVSGSKPL